MTSADGRQGSSLACHVRRDVKDVGFLTLEVSMVSRDLIFQVLLTCESRLQLFFSPHQLLLQRLYSKLGLDQLLLSIELCITQIYKTTRPRYEPSETRDKHAHFFITQVQREAYRLSFPCPSRLPWLEIWVLEAWICQAVASSAFRREKKNCVRCTYRYRMVGYVRST